MSSWYLCRPLCFVVLCGVEVDVVVDCKVSYEFEQDFFYRLCF